VQGHYKQSMRIQWTACSICKVVAASDTYIWTCTGTVSIESCVCACASARGLQVRLPDGYSLACDAAVATRLDDQSLALRMDIAVSGAQSGVRMAGQVWDLLRGRAVAGGVRATVLTSGDANESYEQRAHAASAGAGTGAGAGAGAGSGAGAGAGSGAGAGAGSGAGAGAGSGAGAGDDDGANLHGGAHARHVALPADDERTLRLQKLIANIPAKAMREWFLRFMNNPPGKAQNIAFGDASTLDLPLKAVTGDIAALPESVRDKAIYIDVTDNMGILNHYTAVTGAHGTVSTLPTRFEMLNMVYAAMKMEAMDDVEWQARMRCVASGNLLKDIDIMDTGRTDMLADASCCSTGSFVGGDDDVRALIERRQTTNGRMFVIRTRVYAEQSVHCGPSYTYALDSVLPQHMSVRFLTVHTPGVWELHMQDCNSPIVLPAGVTLDLAPYAVLSDHCLLTHFMPQRNGLSLLHRGPFIRRHVNIDAPMPPQIQFTAAGTTLVLLSDDYAYPMAGYMFCKNYRSPLDDLVNASWQKI
jgi:hypothetical protein